MNQFKFTEENGFPFDQQVLEFMQTAVFDINKWHAHTSGTSYTDVILSGAVMTAGTASAGWVMIDGEVLPFVGGGPGFNNNSYINVVETAAQLEFEDGLMKDVKLTRHAEISAVDSGAGRTYGTMTRFEKMLGERAAKDFTTEVISTFGSGDLSGTVKYRVNWLNRTVEIEGSFNSAVAQSIANPPVYTTMLQMPYAWFLPKSSKPFSLQVNYATSFIQPASNSGYILQLNGLLEKDDGNDRCNLKVGWIRPAAAVSAYAVTFHFITSLAD